MDFIGDWQHLTKKLSRQRRIAQRFEEATPRDASLFKHNCSFTVFSGAWWTPLRIHTLFRLSRNNRFIGLRSKQWAAYNCRAAQTCCAIERVAGTGVTADTIQYLGSSQPTHGVPGVGHLPGGNATTQSIFRRARTRQ